MLIMPKKYIGKFTNGGIVCDMLIGPCACGATHEIEDWLVKIPKNNHYSFTEQELYDHMQYFAFCIENDFENNIQSCSTHEMYQESLNNSNKHIGDCTKMACPCERCHLHSIEIIAQNMVNSMTSEKVGHCGRNCLKGCKGIKTE